jgi:predicted transcriptional regulator
MKRTLTRKPSPKMTPEIAAAIKRMREAGLFTHQIAAELGINQGRVSEVITGKRFKDEPPSVQMPFDF